MAIGPLESFVFPGVFVKTINESSGVSAAGNIRFPAIVGTSAEEVRVADFEMVRGSSSTADNIILDEDVSSQFTGTEKVFTVANLPIVTGDGTGRVATSPNSVIVTVNSQPVAVNSINGLTGEVTLVQIPAAGDDVRANYYFKRRDTYIEDEDVSDQVGLGSVVTFKTHSYRICKGDNSGRAATDADINGTVNILYDPTPTTNPGDEVVRTVRIFEVTVNGTDAPVEHIDGTDGYFTLVTAPAVGALVKVTYFTNDWQDTFDILPAATVSRLVKVGLSQDTSDYSIGEDCVLANSNELHWGNSETEAQGIYTAGSDPLVDNVTVSLVDTRVFNRVAQPVDFQVAGGAAVLDTEGDKKSNAGNLSYVLPTTPVKGDGKGTATEDPNDLGFTAAQAFLGTVATGPLTPVTILSVVGTTVTVDIAALVDQKLFVTYYENLIVDDTWLLTNEVMGGTGVGKYTISSLINNDALDVAVAAGGSLAPIYAGSGATNVQVEPVKASVERVTLTFDGTGKFTVSSKLGPGFGTDGRTGSDITYLRNIGRLGKTYIDPTTGFRLALAAAGDWGGDPILGDTIIYDIGDPTTSGSSPDTSKYITAAAPIKRLIPGLNITVATTDGGGTDNTGDTVNIYSFNKSGNEPDVGDTYYVSFDKEKLDYTTKFLTTMRDVIKYYGPIDINNRCTLAANLMFQNGARAVAIKQIQKTVGGTDASVQDYIDGIDSFNEPMQNGLRPTLMQPLSTDSQVHAYLKTSNAIQSSIRYRNERTSIIGFEVGTTSDAVISRVQALNTEKVTAVYPDGAIIGITDTYGNEVEYIVDGSMIASAVAGRDVSPISDIATPLTNANIVGFKRLYRRLDNVTAALVANSGCTVLEEQTPVIRILMYLTTDLSTPLTRDPRIVEVKHFIQQGVRSALNRYIGVKNLPKMQPQIKDTMGAYFKDLKRQEIIVNYTGINVKQNETDPSTVDVEAYYSPVFPLNWIMVTLNLRSSV